jgi:hypothetical protein
MNPITKRILIHYALGAALLGIVLLMLPSLYAGVPALASYYFFTDASRRRHGQVVERRSVNSLKLPSDWTVVPSKTLPGHGDIDLYVKRPDGQAFAIEIKSQRLVRFKRNLFTGKGSLYYQANKPSKDALLQCMRAADVVGAHPIIWFPKASTAGTWRIKHPVPYTVIFGSKRRVRRALGAPWSLF